MRYERDDSLSKAAGLVWQRVRALPEFTAERGRLVAMATALCADRDVEEMRSLGGFSAVLERLIEQLPEACRVNHGSKLIPLSVSSALRAEIPSMRYDVQVALSRRAV